jgi:hypothetical protein
MPQWPRLTKDVRMALVTILTSESFVSEDEMVKAIWQAVYGDLSERDTYALGWSWGGLYRAWGPFYSVGDMRKFVELTGGPGTYRYAQLHGPATKKTHDELLAEALEDAKKHRNT